MVNTCGMMLRNFLLSKPPMVVFIVCLFAFAFTTLSLSFYVSHTDNIPNPDILSWNSLLKKISTLEFCIQHPENVTSQASKFEAVSNTETASLSVPISPKFLTDFRLSIANSPGDVFLARGEIAISKLGRHMSRYEGNNIIISFEISGKEANDEVCLFIEGSKHLLSDLNSGISPNNCSSDVFSHNATILSLRSHSQDEGIAPNWCDASGGKSETPMALEFVEQPDWAVYVSMRDKEMMQLHLLVILSFIIVGIIKFS